MGYSFQRLFDELRKEFSRKQVLVGNTCCTLQTLSDSSNLKYQVAIGCDTALSDVGVPDVKPKMRDRLLLCADHSLGVAHAASIRRAYCILNADDSKTPYSFVRELAMLFAKSIPSDNSPRVTFRADRQLSVVFIRRRNLAGWSSLSARQTEE